MSAVDTARLLSAAPEPDSVLREVARGLRQRATSLRQAAEHLTRHADLIERGAFEASGRTLLRGSEIAVAAAKLLEPGTVAHYRDLYERLCDAGYAVSGLDPLATFLTTVHRSPLFRVVGSRRGHVERVVDEGADRRGCPDQPFSGTRR